MTLKFYVYCVQHEEVTVRVFRDLEELRNGWLSALENNESWLAHVGISRPDSSLVTEYIKESGKFYYTDAFRYVAHKDLTKGQRVGDIPWGKDSPFHDLGVYMAFDGWGYHQSLEHIEKADALGESIEQGLISNLSNTVPLHEIDDPVELIVQAPDAFLDIAVSTVRLPTRLANILDREGVVLFRDLIGRTKEEMFSWAGFGNKTYSDLLHSMQDICEKSFPNLRIKVNEVVECETYEEETKDIQAGLMPSQTLAEWLDCLLSSCDARDQDVFYKRFGKHGNTLILQEIADSYGISRERVRQIEAKTLRKLEGLKHALHSHIMDLLDRRSDPLYLEFLEVEDTWFEGVSTNLVYYMNIISAFSDEEFSILDIAGRRVLCRLHPEQVQSIKDQLKNIIESHGGNGINHEELVLQAAGLLIPYNSGELAMLLTQSLQPEICIVDGKIIALGASVNSVVNSLVKTVNTPLHYSEYTRLASITLGQPVNERYVHSILGQNAYLFGRGIYGGKHHLGVTAEVESEVLSICEAIVLGDSNSERQWSCSELLEELEVVVPDVAELLTKYDINIILSESVHLKSVGRFIWVNREKSGQRQRIDVADACAVILREAGGPLSENELKSRLRRSRGLDEFTLIFPTKNMAKVAERFWGLVERDFYLTSDGIRSLMGNLYMILNRRNKALHVSELKQAIDDVFSTPRNLTDYMILGLSQIHDEFRVFRGNLVGLSSWDTPGRMNIREAVKQFAAQMELPFTTEEIIQTISQLVERPVDMRQLNSMLNECSIRYDSALHLWFPSVEGDMPDEDRT